MVRRARPPRGDILFGEAGEQGLSHAGLERGDVYRARGRAVLTHLMRSSGSMRLFPLIAPTWTCGLSAEAFPVMPTLPMRVSCFTMRPTFTDTVFRWQYFITNPPAETICTTLPLRQSFLSLPAMVTLPSA